MDPFLQKAKNILDKTTTIAVLGISDKPDRPSYGVAEYLMGYFTVIPVNPHLKEWKGLTCYPDLTSIPEHIDLVNIFRRSELVMPVVDEAITKNIPAIWMQLGVINEEAANKAESLGIQVIVDSCIAVVHQRLE